ncbi:MAG: hypothetical protein WD512_06710, partial [Candidatus Paceibacterota bacterium]
FGHGNIKIMPYNYEVVKVVEGAAEEMFELELKLHKQNSNYKYRPKIKFDGFYECFYKIEEGLLDYMGNFN